MRLTPPALPYLHPVTLLATWFGSGLLRPAPGTWGSLAALLTAWPIYHFGGYGALAIATILVTALGIPICGLYEKAKEAQSDGKSDPGEVVIDEVAGLWIALLPLAASSLQGWDLYLAAIPAFLLFRLFDIWKPFPIGFLDRKLKGGLGIMIDDLVAGLYAGTLLAAGLWLIIERAP